MELRHLRHFVALAEELHYGRAAQRLALTQPPLTLSIQALERTLGTQLFDRSRRRVALTHAGATLLEHARAILAQTENAIAVAQAAQRGEVGRLVIGFMSATVYTVLPSVLREFRGQFPQVRLELREMTLPQQFAALGKGDIGVGFVRPPVPDEALEATVLLRERLVVAFPAGHPLTKMSRVSARRLAGLPFVMFQRSPGLVLHDLVTDFCRSQGFVPQVAQEASQTHAVAGLVSAGIGVALVPASARSIQLRGIEYRPLVERSPAVLTALAWRRGDTSPVVRAFRTMAGRVSRELGAASRTWASSRSS
jgi:DNA-binding transcriptional LysR family regulator